VSQHIFTVLQCLNAANQITWLLHACSYRTKESAVRAELRGIQDERSRIKGLQDEAYGRIVGARNQARDKSRVWGDNRWVPQVPRNSFLSCFEHS
jgi:hypothetical protein